MKQLKNKIKTFFNNQIVASAFTLIVCSLICKILGVVYKIPLTNILGIEGIGIYQLIFPIYSFLVVLSSNALPVAISKYVAEKIKENKTQTIMQIKQVALNFFAFLGLFFSLMLCVCAKNISMLQGNENAVLGYYAISLSVFFVCLISVYRGVFQGYKIMGITGISQIIEQSLKFVLGIILPVMLIPYGVKFAVSGALVAVTFSEIVAYIYLAFKFHFFAKKQNLQYVKNEKNIIICKNLFKYIMPIFLSNIIMPLCVVLESFFIINILRTSGSTIAESTQLYGAYSGIVCTLINAPIQLANSIAITMVPYVVNEQNREENYNLTLKFTLLISLIFIFGYITFGKIALEIFYINIEQSLINLTYLMLIFSSLNIFTLSFSYLICLYMQTQQIMYTPVKVFAIMNILRLFVGFLVLYNFGILQYCIVCAVINFLQLLQLLKEKQNITLKAERKAQQITC